MKLREIQPADDAKIAAIIRESLEDAGLAIPGTAYFDPELAHLSDYYQQSLGRQYFILEEGAILGGVGIAECGKLPGVAELQKLYLAPAARGRRLSPRLLTAALDFATAADYQAVYLESHHQLEAAIALYEKFGFQALPAPLILTPHNAMDRFYIKTLKKEV